MTNFECIKICHKLGFNFAFMPIFSILWLLFYKCFLDVVLKLSLFFPQYLTSQGVHIIKCVVFKGFSKILTSWNLNISSIPFDPLRFKKFVEDELPKLIIFASYQMYV
jgi:hypothetical protein